MDGIIVVDKPCGMTSFDVVSQIKKIYQTKKVGHCGTLDPLATGVLVVCVNNATKLCQIIEAIDKTYLVKVRFGLETDTYDTDGKVISSVETHLTIDEINKALSSFIGTIEQYPPIYSALKVKGKKLYNYARSNLEVEIPKRTCQIYQIDWDEEIETIDGYQEISFSVKVSKGTYIRSLAHDLGLKLNTFAVVSGLRRMEAGRFKISDSHKLADITIDTPLIKMVDSLEMPIYDIKNNKFFTKLISNGVKLTVDEIIKFFNLDYPMVAFKEEDKLLAIYEKVDNYYKVVRVWN